MINQPYYFYGFFNPQFGYMPTCSCQHQRHTYDTYKPHPMNHPLDASPLLSYEHQRDNQTTTLYDHGKEPFVLNIHEAANRNHNFRTTLWTGDYFQVTVMHIDVGEDVGLEMHSDVDQFLRIEGGEGLVQMGHKKDHLNFVRSVQDDSAIIVPAGIWHNITNTGNRPLKLYSIYAPPNHPFNTVHLTKADDLEH